MYIEALIRAVKPLSPGFSVMWSLHFIVVGFFLSRIESLALFELIVLQK